MFLLLDAGMQGIGRVTMEDGHPRLTQHFARIDSRIDDVDGAPGFIVSGFERLLPGMKPGILR